MEAQSASRSNWCAYSRRLIKCTESTIWPGHRPTGCVRNILPHRHGIMGQPGLCNVGINNPGALQAGTGRASKYAPGSVPP
jgi:hypothetical protein